jgi:cyclic beta-1,2-glucan synthetase
MDERSRALYHAAVMELSKILRAHEKKICTVAVNLARSHPVAGCKTKRLHSHVGYYLLDDGVSQLCRHFGMRPSLFLCLRGARLLGILLRTYAAVVFALSALAFSWCQEYRPITLASIVLGASLAVSVSRLVIVLMIAMLFVLVPSSLLPAVQISGDLPADLMTLVAVPVLLIDNRQAESVVSRMQSNFDVLGERNVLMVLLTDDQDSDSASEAFNPTLEYCSSLLQELNSQPKYVKSKPFFLLHRRRVYCRTQRAWIGWERKRGKIDNLFSYVVEGSPHFIPYVGEPERLRSAKYALVIDEDCRVRGGCVRQLVGVLIHPLNHPQLDRASQTLLRGYGILQPTLVAFSGTDVKLSSTTTEPRDLYQDVARESTFFGKGMIDIHVYHALLTGALPEERIVSHDVVESGFVSTGGVPWVVLEEHEPAGTAYHRRQHRWIRGDWQNLVWLLVNWRRMGDRFSLLGKWGIAENCVRSLFPIALTILLAYGFAFDSRYAKSALIVIFGPGLVSAFAGLLLNPERTRSGVISRWVRLLHSCWRRCAFIATLPLEAAISIDAIFTALIRSLIKRRLLDWQTAAASEKHAAPAMTKIDFYPHLLAVSCFALFIASLDLKHHVSIAILLLLWAARNISSVRDLA